MSTYYEYQDVKVKIAHRLMRMDGWKVYGYKADESDGMTDYYSPAYWRGVATKNGFVLCVNVYGERKDPEYYTVRTAAQAQTDAETAAKIAKLEQMTQERGATAAEEATAKAKIELLRNKSAEDDGYTEERKLVEPAHKANPPRCNWHIEKDGIILDKGTGLLKYARVPDISGFGYGWEREEWQKFNTKTPEEWKKEYTESEKMRWNESEEIAAERAERAYNDAVEKYALLDKFNALIARFNNVCGGMVSNGSGEDGFIYEEVTETEYKTELKPQKAPGGIQEGQCFIVKSGFNYGHNKGYVYRIHKHYTRTDGTQTYIAYRLGKGYKKERTGTATAGNSWIIYDHEKFLKWFESGALAFVDLVEVKTPYQVKKVIKKAVTTEPRTAEQEQPQTATEATQEPQEQPETITAKKTPTAKENAPKTANREPKEATAKETPTEAEKAPEAPTDNAQQAQTATADTQPETVVESATTATSGAGADMFADLAKAYINGKQAPKQPHREPKQEQPKKEPTTEEKPQEEPQTESEEPQPAPAGYHGKSCEVLTAADIETLTSGGTVYKAEERYLMRHYTAIPYPGAAAWLVYVISGETIEPGRDAKYSGFIVNGLYYQGTAEIRAKLADDINAELLRMIPDEETATRLFEESNPEQYQRDNVKVYKEYSRESDAKQLYYKDKLPSIRLYDIKGDKISAGDVIRYLINPESIIKAIAQAFAASHRLDIVRDWIEYTKTLSAYNAIIADKTHESHKIKRIIDAVTDEKTIKIKLSNGHTVKAEARAVSGLQHSGYISSYYIAAADRQHIDRNEYGRAKDITAADIVSITHGQRTLYKAS